MKISIRRLPHAKDLPLPSYATEGSAGLDLLAAMDEEIVLAPRERRAIPSGIAIALPMGYEAQIRPRSGLALRYGVTVLNAPGTIDADYRGEVMTILVNHGPEGFTIKRGMKIAQMVIAAYVRAEWDEAELLETTARGTGGFGSTGLGYQLGKTQS
jgi:dUTP pyrophosphatase